MKQMKSKGFMGLEHWKLIALYLLIYDIVTINLSYLSDYGFVLICSIQKYLQSILWHLLNLHHFIRYLV